MILLLAHYFLSGGNAKYLNRMGYVSLFVDIKAFLNINLTPPNCTFAKPSNVEHPSGLIG